MKSAFILLLICIALRTDAQDVLHPVGLTSMAEVEGDLDKDGIAEKVVVYETTDTTDDGTVRELRIYRKIQGKWQSWVTTRNAILKSQEGGMMGDPFGELEIKNGILLISFNGGSSWKWNYTDKYRFQNDTFQLIGYTSFYGKPCEYWVSVDCNISTGKFVYKKEFEECENDDQTVVKTETETFVNKIPSPNIHNRYPSEIKVITPKYKAELYF